MRCTSAKPSRSEHQRRGGNARTQAQVQGWIVRVPQLFIYLSDYSAAFHMDGIRSGFERQLNWVIDRSRTERSMIRLDRLLERLTTEDGEEFSLESLPRADVYILLYRRAECETCDELDDMLSAWLDTKTRAQGGSPGYRDGPDSVIT